MFQRSTTNKWTKKERKKEKEKETNKFEFVLISNMGMIWIVLCGSIKLSRILANFGHNQLSHLRDGKYGAKQQSSVGNKSVKISSNDQDVPFSY